MAAVIFTRELNNLNRIQTNYKTLLERQHRDTEGKKK